MSRILQVPDQPSGEDRTVSVLYVHHAGAFGGASRSLLELIEGLPSGSILPRLVTQRGSVGRIFRARGIDVIEAAGISQFDHTRFNHYRGRRWLVLLREMLYLPFTVLALIRARTRWREIDIIHVNELVALAAVVVGKMLFRCPVVVHVRSVQENRRGRLRSRSIGTILRRYVDAVVAIDETVRKSLPQGVPAAIIHNAHSPRRTTPATPSNLRLPPKRPGTLRVAMVGSPLGFKGVREFVEAARLCRNRSLATDFLMVGINTTERPGWGKRALKAAGFSHDVRDDLKLLVEQHGLTDCVHLLGFTTDIDQVYRQIDVLCFPSHLDAVGRPVFEAAFWKVPSIVAVSDPAPDTMIHRETGLCIEPASPVAIADAVEYFSLNPSEIIRMGEAAHRLALENFDSRQNAARVLEVYHRVLGAARRKTPA